MDEIASYAIGSGQVDKERAQALAELDQRLKQNAGLYGATLMKFTNPDIDLTVFTMQDSPVTGQGYATAPVTSRLLV